MVNPTEFIINNYYIIEACLIKCICYFLIASAELNKMLIHHQNCICLNVVSSSYRNFCLKTIFVFINNLLRKIFSTKHEWLLCIIYFFNLLIRVTSSVGKTMRGRSQRGHHPKSPRPPKKSSSENDTVTLDDVKGMDFYWCLSLILIIEV